MSRAQAEAPVVVRRARRTWRASVRAALVVGLVAASGCSDDDDSDTASATTATTRPPDVAAPAIVPTPQQIRWLGPDVEVPASVSVVVGNGVDEAARRLVDDVLQSAGMTAVEAASDDAELVVHAGLVSDESTRSALEDAGVDVPAEIPAEGYVLAVAASDDDGPSSIVLGGADAAGVAHAAQTLRQVADDDSIAGVAVVDHPSMPRRGVVEGFYGSPWSQAERLDQLAFYGQMKLNTYIYAPKADPFHRDRWREPYPAGDLAALGQLVEAAQANHVRFTFAVSPGPSICYSAPADVAALEAKLGALYDQGVRDFAVALDDISYERWNCPADQARYGPNTQGSAAQAQVDLLNGLQRGFAADHQGTRPFILVPTEYRNTDDSPYRQVIRSQLDPAIEVMWTGTLVVPAEITGPQAAAARQLFGRPVFVWDNYPVNDFPATEGRLLLGPYVRRDPALAGETHGIVSNPMNQASASKVALTGVADFTWNSPAYDPSRAHRAAASRLAGGDPATTEALLAFLDLSTYTPTSSRSGVPSQPQAPTLAGKIAAFDAAWAAGDRAGAIAGLRPYADVLAAAPDRLRTGVTDQAFISDCLPWLDALTRWGQAFVATLNGLQAQVDGDTAAARSAFATATAEMSQARAVHTIAGKTLPQGPVLLGDGVLDRFITTHAG